ncbi:CBS domain-containing protein [Streptomyces sp. A1547]|uniref:CBS domain-containing protein n=1 Tax=Streptomyces sp. A1547 TaxID=2563105 RepID=UPI00109EC3D3|nr:CBS domain-containing protein [Streptomyces sp. A1547]THA41795.1 CBS domain-containing protein [Streptomyces sp. A1547]
MIQTELTWTWRLGPGWAEGGGAMATANEIVSTPPERTVSVEVDESIDGVVSLMLKHNVGLVFVVEQGVRYVGVVTQRAALRELHNHAPGYKNVLDLTDYQYPSVSADSSADSVAETMIEHGVRKLPVVDSGDLLGLVTEADVAKSLSVTESSAFLRRLWKRLGRETDDTGPNYDGGEGEAV